MINSSDPGLLADAVNSLDDLFYVFTPGGEYVEWNARFTSVTGYDNNEIGDLNPADLVPEGERGDVRTAIKTITNDRTAVTLGTVLETKTGERLPYEFQWTPVEDEDESLKAIASIGRNITERNRQREIQESLADELAKRSVPIVEVWDGILLSTIIGKLDSAQAQDFTEKLLERISETEATVAIIDITGAEAVDTQTAQHLIDTIHAVKLMGGQTIITGLNPEISQTLVQLGIGFDVETQSSLQEGLKTALDIAGVSFD
ncbi:STAS domain-containing protein [Halorubrum sp. BV1]|uniref:STAS domain-containing protein n=1 Tax=Halorubrum sp. BV1 TaxID=1498500 RepID=UPI0006792A09|nr:STAS domain-containing protein [Halorubrum sp. BV1]